MPSIFISHSSADNDVVREVVKALEGAGYASLFIDYDPERGIAPGRDWRADLDRHLKMCDALVFVASAASIASKWCFAELVAARLFSRPIIPLALEKNLLHPLLEPVQSLTWRDDRDDAMKRLLRGLEQAGLEKNDAFDLAKGRAVFPGLRAFDVEDAGAFYARDRDTKKILDRLLRPIDPTVPRFIAVAGPSGSGKSSLARAGVLARVARLDSWVVLRPATPGAEPMDAIARVFAKALKGPRDGTWTKLAKDVLTAANGDPHSVLLLIDQLEEVLTRASEKERTELFAAIRRAVEDPDGPLWILATLRSEFLTPMMRVADAKELIASPYLIGTIDVGLLSMAIEEPARKAGLALEPGLATRIARDSEGAASLPLMAYMLELLQERGFTHRAYEELGGVSGALRRRADEIFEVTAKKSSREAVIAVLLRLVTVSDEDAPARQRVRRGTLSAAENAILQPFIDARLLRSDEERGEAIVEVAHEALIKEWPALRDAVAASLADLRLVRSVERAAREWIESGRSESYLWIGDRLALVDTKRELLAGSSREFIVASQQRDLSALVRAANNVASQVLRDIDADPERGLLLALAAIDEYVLTDELVFAVSSCLRASSIRGRVTTELPIFAVAFSPDVRTAAIASATNAEMLRASTRPIPRDERTKIAIWDIPSATKLAEVELDDRVRDLKWVPHQFLVAAGLKRIARWTFRGDEATRASTVDVSGALVRAISDDGAEALLEADGELRIVEVASGDLVHTIAFAGTIVRGAYARTPRRAAAVVTPDQKVFVWLEGVPWSDFEVPLSASSAAFSPDGERLLLWGLGAIDVVDLREHAFGKFRVSENVYKTAVASKRVSATAVAWFGVVECAMALSDGTAQLLRIATIPAISEQTYKTNIDDAHSIAWDDEFCALGRFREVALFGASSSALSFGVKEIAFAADGKLLMLEGDGVVRDSALQTLWSCTGIASATRAAFSAARSALAIGTARGAHIHDLEAKTTIELDLPSSINGLAIGPGMFAHVSRTAIFVRELATHASRSFGEHDDEDGDVYDSIAVSPDGTQIAVGSIGGGRAGLWDAASGTLLHRLRGRNPAFSEDGTRVALGNRVFDTSTGAVITALNISADAASFASDGTLLVTAGADGFARVWSSATGKPLHAFDTGDPLARAIFSPDGRSIATLSRAGVVRSFENLTPDETIALARRRVYRALTEAERREFGLTPRA